MGSTPEVKTQSSYASATSLGATLFFHPLWIRIMVFHTGEQHIPPLFLCGIPWMIRKTIQWLIEATHVDP